MERDLREAQEIRELPDVSEHEQSDDDFAHTSPCRIGPALAIPACGKKQGVEVGHYEAPVRQPSASSPHDQRQYETDLSEEDDAEEPSILPNGDGSEYPRSEEERDVEALLEEDRAEEPADRVHYAGRGQDSLVEVQERPEVLSRVACDVSCLEDASQKPSRARARIDARQQECASNEND